ncbi:MAG TPA: fatty acid hydroxylase, partial [Rhodanobacter sp.]|nr:fatty acid hydroxylase [Rhodanobacter sp.]
LIDPDRPQLHNCNFGQVFSIWDVIFGTALYGEAPRPTGVGDPVVDADNNCGVIGLQWVSFKRFWASVWRPAGWKLGEVAFDPVDLHPVPVSELDVHALAHHLPGATPAHAAAVTPAVDGGKPATA